MIGQKKHINQYWRRCLHLLFLVYTTDHVCVREKISLPAGAEFVSSRCLHRYTAEVEEIMHAMNEGGYNVQVSDIAVGVSDVYICR